uniref:Envelope fusion glycoprotein n=1 Tax=Adineta vaga TaxID=104782 RepID=A0A1W6BQZ3_ADIVA|nr:envelope fusion glycoprotein [Adineta vaga]
MQNHIMVVLCILIVYTLHLNAYSNGTISRDTITAHPETGLFLDYTGVYTPAEAIIHKSVVFPMTTTTCHFLPLSAVEIIPSCNITIKRNKRYASTVISVINLFAGDASLGMSIYNSMQTAHLQEQITLVQGSLTKFSKMVDIHQGQLVKLTEKHIELTDQLQVTQKAPNDLIPVINSHSNAINYLKTDVENLKIEFKKSFLYSAISQISRDELTLSFLSPDDIHKVAYYVIREGNLTFNSYPGFIPVIQIITKLIVRQQIEFVPSSLYSPANQEEIGRLVITSFFAVPKRKQTPFNVYKIVKTPLVQGNEAYQLAEVPTYWAINPVNNFTFEWQNPHESGCDFRFMTSCRDTPPFHQVPRDTCLDQILRKLPVSMCQTTSIPAEKYFLRQPRGNVWITSSSQSIHCMRIPRTEYQNANNITWNTSEEIILPRVSLVNVTDGYTIECPGFTLTGQPLPSNISTLVILYNSGALTNNISVLNVHKYMTENMTLFKHNIVEQDRRTLMDFVNRVNALATYETPLSTHEQSFLSSLMSYFIQISSFGIMSSFNWIFFGLAGVLLYCVYRCKTKTITLAKL